MLPSAQSRGPWLFDAGSIQLRAFNSFCLKAICRRDVPSGSGGKISKVANLEQDQTRQWRRARRLLSKSRLQDLRRFASVTYVIACPHHHIPTHPNMLNLLTRPVVEAKKVY